MLIHDSMLLVVGSIVHKAFVHIQSTSINTVDQLADVKITRNHLTINCVQLLLANVVVQWPSDLLVVASHSSHRLITLFLELTLPPTNATVMASLATTGTPNAPTAL
jgi:hypothetical protein